MKRKTRNVGLIRLLRMERLLREQPRTADALARIFRVSRRTIYRDFDVLEAAGYRITVDQPLTSTGWAVARYSIRRPLSSSP